MNYYITECEAENCQKKTAGIKARDDLDSLFELFHMKQIRISAIIADRENVGIIKKIKYHFIVKKNWEKELEILNEGDSLVIQFPIIGHSLLLSSVLKKLVKKKKINVVLFVHDLEVFRIGKNQNVGLKRKSRIYLEEMKAVKNCKTVVHNSSMKSKLKELGVNEERLFDLQIFDYLIPEFDNRERKQPEKEFPIIIAGNLVKSKAGYVYELPDSVKFNLYGVNYSGEGSESINYCGSFEPDELPFELNGSFGLVWDGLSASTCEGIYGEYLRINNPHKTSLYLASGIPVIIWNNAALAGFIEEHKCGFCVDSIGAINDVLKKLTDEEYSDMKKNAENEGLNLRSGYYTRRVLEKAGVIIS